MHVPKLCSTIFAHQNLQNLGWKICAPSVLYTIKAVSTTLHRDWRIMEKTDLQNLIDYHSNRISLIDIGGESSVAKNFYKVSVDGQSIGNWICCKKCKKVIAKGDTTLSNVYRHLLAHKPKSTHQALDIFPWKTKVKREKQKRDDREITHRSHKDHRHENHGI